VGRALLVTAFHSLTVVRFVDDHLDVEGFGRGQEVGLTGSNQAAPLASHQLCRLHPAVASPDFEGSITMAKKKGKATWWRGSIE
jgi:hypothetical protein